MSESSQLENILSTQASESSQQSSHSSVPVSSPIVKKKQSKFRSLEVDTVSNQQKEEIDIALGMFLYSSPDPLTTIANPHFKKLLTILRPGYQILDSAAIKGPILEKCYEIVQSSSYQPVQKYAVLMINKVSNSILKCLAIPRYGKSVYLKSLEYSVDPSNFNENLQTLVTWCKEKYNIQIEICAVSGIEILQIIDLFSTAEKYVGCEEFAEIMIQKVEDQELFKELSEILDYFKKHEELQEVIRSFDMENTLV